MTFENDIYLFMLQHDTVFSLAYFCPTLLGMCVLKLKMSYINRETTVRFDDWPAALSTKVDWFQHFLYMCIMYILIRQLEGLLSVVIKF